jgi:hypothetical protein
MLSVIRNKVRIAIDNLWYKNKLEPIKQVVTKRNEMMIYFIDGTVSRFWIDNWKGKHVIAPWTKFYKWFFARLQSEYFIMDTDNGHHMIRRVDIKRFSVMIITETNEHWYRND